MPPFISILCHHQQEGCKISDIGSILILMPFKAILNLGRSSRGPRKKEVRGKERKCPGFIYKKSNGVLNMSSQDNVSQI